MMKENFSTNDPMIISRKDTGMPFPAWDQNLRTPKKTEAFSKLEPLHSFYV